MTSAAEAEMMAFWHNLGHPARTVAGLLLQPVVLSVEPEVPLPPERYETDEEVAAKRAKRDEQKVRDMAKRYAVKIEEMRKWLNLAKGPCSICRRLPREGRRHPIDHCHRSGKIRAPLCNRCNTLVGQLEGNRELVPVAFAYIQRFKDAFK